VLLFSRQFHGRPDRAILTAALLLLAAIASIAIWTWQASPYGRYLHHETPTVELPLEVGLFTAGWLLMVVAMMLPTTIPLVGTFAMFVSRRSRRGQLVGLLVAGYVATWSVFGLAAFLADRMLHATVAAVPFLAAYPQLILAATLGLAGAWQFSALKYRCLDECRSPLGFVLNRWQGVAPGKEAFRLGVAHGLFCIGCCWSLMLVTFGLGMGNLAWMLVFGGVMAIEKNASWGRRISRPLGGLLVLAAVVAVAA
jgi:predicted metal-binding membrane protein